MGRRTLESDNIHVKNGFSGLPSWFLIQRVVNSITLNRSINCSSAPYKITELQTETTKGSAWPDDEKGDHVKSSGLPSISKASGELSNSSWTISNHKRWYMLHSAGKNTETKQVRSITQNSPESQSSAIMWTMKTLDVQAGPAGGNSEIKLPKHRQVRKFKYFICIYAKASRYCESNRNCGKFVHPNLLLNWNLYAGRNLAQRQSDN